MYYSFKKREKKKALVENINWFPDEKTLEGSIIVQKD